MMMIIICIHRAFAHIDLIISKSILWKQKMMFDWVGHFLCNFPLCKRTRLSFLFHSDIYRTRIYFIASYDRLCRPSKFFQFQNHFPHHQFSVKTISKDQNVWLDDTCPRISDFQTTLDQRVVFKVLFKIAILQHFFSKHVFSLLHNYLLHLVSWILHIFRIGLHDYFRHKAQCIVGTYTHIHTYMKWKNMYLYLLCRQQQ
jgi:hypothetical protein